MFLHSKVFVCVCAHVFLSSNVANSLGAGLHRSAKPRAQCRPDTAGFPRLKQKHTGRTSVVSKRSLSPHINKHF